MLIHKQAYQEMVDAWLVSLAPTCYGRGKSIPTASPCSSSQTKPNKCAHSNGTDRRAPNQSGEPHRKVVTTRSVSSSQVHLPDWTFSFATLRYESPIIINSQSIKQSSADAYGKWCVHPLRTAFDVGHATGNGSETWCAVHSIEVTRSIDAKWLMTRCDTLQCAAIVSRVTINHVLHSSGSNPPLARESCRTNSDHGNSSGTIHSLETDINFPIRDTRFPRDWNLEIRRQCWYKTSAVIGMNKRSRGTTHSATKSAERSSWHSEPTESARACQKDTFRLSNQASNGQEQTNETCWLSPFVLLLAHTLPIENM